MGHNTLISNIGSGVEITRTLPFNKDKLHRFYLCNKCEHCAVSTWYLSLNRNESPGCCVDIVEFSRYILRKCPCVQHKNTKYTKIKRGSNAHSRTIFISLISQMTMIYVCLFAPIKILRSFFLVLANPWPLCTVCYCDNQMKNKFNGFSSG